MNPQAQPIDRLAMLIVKHGLKVSTSAEHALYMEKVVAQRHLSWSQRNPSIKDRYHPEV